VWSWRWVLGFGFLVAIGIFNKNTIFWELVVVEVKIRKLIIICFFEEGVFF